MKKINLYCPINFTGYGIAGLNIATALNNQSDVTLNTIGGIQADNPDDIAVIKQLLSKQDTIDGEAPCLKIWHQFDLAERIGHGKYIAYPFFEIDTFNEREKHHLNLADEIIVSSEWAKNIILNNSIDKPVHIVPLGVNRNIFNSDVNNVDKYDKYVFITVGKWEIRKSHDLVIDLFNKAFDHKDNVELWMVTHNPFLSPEEERHWFNLANNSKLKDKIKIFPRIPSQKELANVMSYASCGIYISRAEGWNLDLLETMSMNKPVIVTNYSGHSEFCNDKNSFLVEIDELETAVDNKWFHGTGKWAKIGPNQQERIISFMRHSYVNTIQTNQEGLNTANTLSWSNTANHILRCI
jgi:glycosyltransferase involved in cell wall biosynthesis